ncbi:MAG: hypothetical protein MZU79_04620 [Anaerotruncus sp.]|nr:hypothetical protein [Anaerotruncus sp.]
MSLLGGQGPREAGIPFLYATVDHGLPETFRAWAWPTAGFFSRRAAVRRGRESAVVNETAAQADGRPGSPAGRALRPDAT